MKGREWAEDEAEIGVREGILSRVREWNYKHAYVYKHDKRQKWPEYPLGRILYTFASTQEYADDYYQIKRSALELSTHLEMQMAARNLAVREPR